MSKYKQSTSKRATPQELPDLTPAIASSSAKGRKEPCVVLDPGAAQEKGPHNVLGDSLAEIQRLQ